MPILAAFAVPHPPIILPEIGRGEEAKISATINAFAEVARRFAALRPDVAILTTPHSVMYSDYFHISPGRSASGDFSRFGAGGVRVQVDYDVEFAAALEKSAEKAGIAAGTLGEKDPALDHGAMIPLRLMGVECPVVRIGLSGLPPIDHYRLGELIAQTAEALGRRAVFIASGDLSHKLKDSGPYGFANEGPIFDREVTRLLKAGDFLGLLGMDGSLCEAAAECGLRSFQIMAGALDGLAVKPELLSYEGPFGVGYGVAAFEVTGSDPARRFGDIYLAEEKQRMETTKSGEDEYVRLARHSLETFVRTGKRAKLPDGLPPELLDNRAGVFVSLKKHGQLRGCIGTISAVSANIAEEILRNAVSACSEDPRFDPVTADELGELEYSVDVLGEPEPVADESFLDPLRYGVIVTTGARRGLLLPNLDGVDTVGRQIEIARQKAGIRPNEPVRLERFEVVRHK